MQKQKQDFHNSIRRNNMDVRINLVKNPESKTKAFVTASYGPEGKKIYLKGMKLVEGQSGLFLAMPSTKMDKPYTNKAGKLIEWEDHFFMDKVVREEMQAEAIRLMPETSFVQAPKPAETDIPF